MSTSDIDSGLNAPANARAVIVLESGVTVSLRLKHSERYSVRRSASEGGLETGYKISDGVVNDAPEINIEGIVTGSAFIMEPNNMERAASEVASIRNAYEREELASVYLSFMAMPDAVITEFSAEAQPENNHFKINLSAKRIKRITFQRTQATGGAPAAKTKHDAGKNKTNTGKKSAAPATEAEKQSTLNAILF